MDKMLAEIGKELTEKGYIQHDLLVWGRRKTATFFRHDMFFFGIKDGKFMVLPFTDFKNIHYEEVVYYEKGSVELKFTGMAAIFSITFKDGNNVRFELFAGRPDIKTIISLYNS